MEGLDVKMFLLFLMALLSLRVEGEAEVKKMDMAPDAVDFDFSECRDEMLKAVTKTGGLLQKELDADKEFKTLWNKNYAVCQKIVPNGTPDHVRALHVYANSKNSFRRKFNDLVQKKGANVTTYKDGFHFKSLYFFLMDSMQLLNHTNSCRNVYFATKNTYTADTGAEVRFGKFMKAVNSKSSQIETIDTEEGGTLFSINSCFVFNVEENTCKSEDVQNIISPVEVFRVQSVKNKTTNDDSDYKEITLQHSRFLSNAICPFLQRLGHSSAGSSAPLLTLKTLVAVMFLTMASLQFMSLL
ncbi:GPI-linked NAD(P)(+)--arginine ADP-ribosyltransferase 1 isoform X1 [Silurus asotus]|uniref:NAD(P)(+)--arginine ADP-ribosyltransferase n=1 Tax=Silurus asotus TaxID=30991 RepID=A0AAD5A5Z2_SILAS|nr:GPI-linked NAD(P)(+)--arginine ADP-ribosyltransferase 1 isoform X1 [Silurus asotus]